MLAKLDIFDNGSGYYEQNHKTPMEFINYKCGKGLISKVHTKLKLNNKIAK
jgi:hypothetical protein